MDISRYQFNSEKRKICHRATNLHFVGELLTIKGETEGFAVVGWLIGSLSVGINDGEADGSSVIGDEVFEVGLPVVCWLDFIKQSSTLQ